jgi:predicted NodU family carbamoyl transferase
MIKLGISAFYHDSASAIVVDGKVIAAIEEEKLSGIKHDNSFPFKAIAWCLKYANITIDDVDQGGPKMLEDSDEVKEAEWEYVGLYGLMYLSLEMTFFYLHERIWAKLGKKVK